MSEHAPLRKGTPLNLKEAAAVVVLVQLLALYITRENGQFYGAVVAGSGPSYAPAGTSVPGSVLNALIVVGFAFVLTLALVWLLRRKMVTSFKMDIFASVSLSAFLLTMVTADVFAVEYLPPSMELPVTFGGAVLVVVLVGYIIFVRNTPWLSTVVLAFVGAEVGSFFAQTLSPWTALALPVAFSVYDIYAVFKGPLNTAYMS